MSEHARPGARTPVMRQLGQPPPPFRKLLLATGVVQHVAGLALAAAFFGFGFSAASFGAELPRGFVLDTLATNLDCATAIAPAPDGRIFIAEQTGQLCLWKNGRLLDAPALKLRVADFWERGLIGVTLAPDFPRTAHLFALYVTDRPFLHHVLSRFTVEGDAVNPASERVLFEGDDQSKLGGFQPGGHQGGPLCFGSDGKLYVAFGEQTAGEPSQKLDTLQGKILRLNPDGSIPEDNPFFSRATGKYRAIWAYGVRNPFGLAVQGETGRMFFTDVGGSAFEEVNELARGANYGWPRAEGYSTNAEFKSPLYAYPPILGRSICGGVFYPKAPVKTLNELNRLNGGSVPEVTDLTIQPFHHLTFPEKWRGKFFFVDFMNHWLKALDPVHPTNVLTFAKGFNGPIAVGVAPDGALLVLNRATIWRDPKRFLTNSGSLVRIRYVGEASLARKEPRPPANTEMNNPLGLPRDARALPQRWSAIASEEKLRALVASGELLPYEVNAPEWHPGMKVDHLLALPRGRKIRFSADGEWQFPAGTVFLRLYWWRTERRAAAPAKLIERRVIVLGEPRGYGASYRVSTDGRDAELVEDGELATLATDGADDKPRYWFYPSLEDLLSLPASNLAYALDTNTRQLNRPGPDGRNQVAAWNQLGLFDPPLRESDLASLPKLADASDSTASTELRVRSYLDVNCAICHQPGGASRGLFDARFVTPLARAGILEGELAAGDLGIAGARVIVPGSPEKSILYQRLKPGSGFFRMPPVQFHDAPSPLLPVLETWIRALKPGTSR